jgi:hypothetical protein
MMENRLPKRATKCLCNSGRYVERSEIRWKNQEQDTAKVLEASWQQKKGKITLSERILLKAVRHMWNRNDSIGFNAELQCSWH